MGDTTTLTTAEQVALQNKAGQDLASTAARHAKNFVSNRVDGAKKTIEETDQIVTNDLDFLGVDKEGKNPIERLWIWLKEFFSPIWKAISDFFSNLFGLGDPNAKITEEKLPEKIKAAGNYKTAATQLGLKEEVATDIQEAIADSAAAYAKDGIPEFEADGTPTTTIKHVIKTHNSIVEYLAGKPGDSAGRLGAIPPYNELPQETRDQAAQYIASYFTGLRPEANLDLVALMIKDANGNYKNISGGLAQTLLAIQAKANTKDANGKATAITEADLDLIFDQTFLDQAEKVLKNTAPTAGVTTDPGLAAAAKQFHQTPSAPPPGQGAPSGAPSVPPTTPAASKQQLGR